MKKKTEKSIVDSLEVNDTIYPHIPYLLQDLWALGSSYKKIIKLFGELRLKGSDKAVLDLGCGKGAVAISIAVKYGCTVFGIDAMDEFIDEAKQKAEYYSVANICNFIKADIVEYTKEKHLFDVVILASLGGIFGNFSETIKILRNQVATGGFIIIDDGYLSKKELLNRKGYGHYRKYETTNKELIEYGDKIIREIHTSEESRRINMEYLHAISKRCAELKNEYPELKDELVKYLSVQREECRIIDNEMEGMLWVLQKV